MKKRIGAALLLAAAVLGGSVPLASPAQAVGRGSWNCTIYSTFSGGSTRYGNSYTAGPSYCGEAEVSVGYTVSGGTALYTPYQQDHGLSIIGNPGYAVFVGRHKMSDAAPFYTGVEYT